MLILSGLLNVVLIVIVWRAWRWRKYVKATMHTALGQAKKTSDALRFVRLEPWRDECVQNATDGIDNLFSIIYGSIYPNEAISINFDDTPPLPVPEEKGWE